MCCNWHLGLESVHSACSSRSRSGAHVACGTCARLALCAASGAGLHQAHSPAPCAEASAQDWSGMDTTCSTCFRPALCLTCDAHPRPWCHAIFLSGGNILLCFLFREMPYGAGLWSGCGRKNPLRLLQASWEPRLAMPPTWTGYRKCHPCPWALWGARGSSWALSIEAKVKIQVSLVWRKEGTPSVTYAESAAC